MANTTQIGPKLWEELFGNSTKAATNKYYNELVDKYTNNPSEYNAKLIEDFDNWRNVRFASLVDVMKKKAGPTLDRPNFDFVAYAEKMKGMTNEQIIFSIKDAKEAEQAMRGTNPKAELWYRDEWLTLADELRKRNKVAAYKSKIMKRSADLIILAASRPYDPGIQGDIKGWNLYDREWEFTSLGRPGDRPAWRLKPQEESLVGKVSELMEKDGIYYAVVNGTPYNISTEVSFGVPGEKEIHKIKKAPPMPDDEAAEEVEPQRAFGGIKMDYKIHIGARAKDPDAALKKIVEQAYYRHGHGVQVNVMDIGKIFAEGVAAIKAGLDIDQEIQKIISKYKMNKENIYAGDYKKKILARMADEYVDTEDSSVHKKIHKVKNMREDGRCPLCPPHAKENEGRKVRDDKYKNKDRETIRKTEAMQKVAGYDYLIDVIMEPQEGVGDRRGAVKFVGAWNQKYPEYPVRIQMNPHDFGSYPSVVIREESMQRAFDDAATFPDGPETAATALADELGLSY